MTAVAVRECPTCSGNGRVQADPRCRCTSVCVCTWDTDCYRCDGYGYLNPPEGWRGEQ